MKYSIITKPKRFIIDFDNENLITNNNEFRPILNIKTPWFTGGYALGTFIVSKPLLDPELRIQRIVNVS